MNAIRKYSVLMLLLTVFVGFTSCEDEEGLEERMFGRVWGGNVGFSDDHGYPLYSEFTFDPSGFGEECQYDDYGLYARYPFQWHWDGRHSHDLILDYGRNGYALMENVDVYKGRMTGIYYWMDELEGFPFSLEMQ